MQTLSLKTALAVSSSALLLAACGGGGSANPTSGSADTLVSASATPTAAISTNTICGRRCEGA